MNHFDVIIVGGGVMGCATALFLARAGMSVALMERGSLCRSASGVNAGTLTLQMTRAALIPHALEGWRLWTTAGDWLGHDVGVVQAPGFCLAFTEAEEALLETRAAARGAAGAPIRLISPAKACQLEPGLSSHARLVSTCAIDGYASAYQTGQAFQIALQEAGCSILEQHEVHAVERGGDFTVITNQGHYQGNRLVLAGGVWLEPLLAQLDVHIPIKTLINQLIVLERLPPVMRSVVTIANGLLSLKQFANGSVVIGGGWQGRGDRVSGQTTLTPENLVGNARLAAYAVPALSQGRILRAWAGFEAETADALPMLGPVPGIQDAYVIGSVHSGYTSGPYMGKLLADLILEREPEMPLFEIDRLLEPQQAGLPA